MPNSTRAVSLPLLHPLPLIIEVTKPSWRTVAVNSDFMPVLFPKKIDSTGRNDSLLPLHRSPRFLSRLIFRSALLPPFFYQIFHSCLFARARLSVIISYPRHSRCVFCLSFSLLFLLFPPLCVPLLLFRLFV